jgi:hypothetical protein
LKVKNWLLFIFSTNRHQNHQFYPNLPKGQPDMVLAGIDDFSPFLPSGLGVKKGKNLI